MKIRRDDVVVPVRPGPDGASGPTKGQVRQSQWRRTSPGLYVPSRVDPTHTGQRIVEAWAGAPEGTAVTGWAALHWSGAEWFAGLDSAGIPRPVPLALGDRRHMPRRAGVNARQAWLFDDDHVTCDGLPLTRPERSTCMEMLGARTFEEAVQAADMALNSRLMTLSDLVIYAERLRGRPGSRRLLSAVAESRENVWSPMETTLRLQWATVRPAAVLVCNTAVVDDDGRHILTPDVFDPEFGIAGEYDGAVHDTLEVRRRDHEREARARAAGIEVVSMSSTDLRDRASFDRRLMAAYARAQRSGGAWTATHHRFESRIG